MSIFSIETVLKSTPLVAAATAVFVAYIGYQQWRTNRHKLRLDLYNKRFDVYAKTICFYQTLCEYKVAKADGRFASAHLDFIRATLESKFLFRTDSEIPEILETLHNDAFKIIGYFDLGAELIKAGLHKEFIVMHNDQRQVLPDFNKAITDLGEKMAPYLNFHESL